MGLNVRTLLKPFELEELEQLLISIHTALACGLPGPLPRGGIKTRLFPWRLTKLFWRRCRVLVVLRVLPATRRLARTASLSFVSRSYWRAACAFPSGVFPFGWPPRPVGVWAYGSARRQATAIRGVAWQRHPKGRDVVCDLASMVPWCARTIWCAMNNPSPSPWWRPGSRSPPRNGSNRWGSSPGGMVPPLTP